MRLVMLGPPGSGKGTQSKFISEEYNIPIIGTGDIFRKLAEKDKSIRDIISSGELVPDERVEDIVAKTLESSNMEKGFIFDDFPRTLHQAKFLDNFLKKHQAKLDAVIFINIEIGRLIERISSRRICKKCGAVYNLITNPSEKPGICDICGGELYQRQDDSSDVVRKRVKKYFRTINDVIDYYRNLSILKDIDGKGSIQEVYSIIMDILESL